MGDNVAPVEDTSIAVEDNITLVDEKTTSREETKQLLWRMIHFCGGIPQPLSRIIQARGKRLSPCGPAYKSDLAELVRGQKPAVTPLLFQVISECKHVFLMEFCGSAPHPGPAKCLFVSTKCLPVPLSASWSS